MTTIKIVKATEKHRKDMSRLIREANIGVLSKREPIRNFWVVKSGGRVIACAGLDFRGHDVAILTFLVVKKEFRHRGIGSALIDHRTKIAKEGGVKTVAFVTMYYWYNFYKKRGFKVCRRANLPENLRDYWMFTVKRYKKCGVMLKYIT